MAPKAGTIRNCIATPRTCPSGRICRMGQEGGLPTALTTKGKIFRRCCLRPGSRLAAHGLFSGTTARGKWCDQPLWREGGAEPLLKRRRVDVRNGVGRRTAAYRWAIPETGQSGSGQLRSFEKPAATMLNVLLSRGHCTPFTTSAWIVHRALAPFRLCFAPHFGR